MVRLLPSKPRSTLLFLGVITFTVLFAWFNRFVYDDAFISFRYAQHLSEGYGLVWNIGDAPIEGYTNFLWTLLMSLSFTLSIDPILFSWVISLLCFIGTLSFTYRLTHELTGHPYWGLVAIFLLGTNITFSAFATSGLETQLHVMLIMAATYFVYRLYIADSVRPTTLIILSFIFAASLMTRLDSAIFVGVLGLGVIYHVLQKDTALTQKIYGIVIFSLPAALLLSIWFIWKLSFYGDVLPNTFYAKVGGAAFVYVRGLLYLFGFWLSYWLFPFPILIGWMTFKKHPLSLINKQIMLIILIWTAYLIYVGGDHMEFRFMVPILPFLFIIIVQLIAEHINRNSIRLILIGLILGGTINHWLTYDHSVFKTHQLSLQAMAAQRTNPYEDWDAIGQVIGKATEFDRTVTIAANPVGLIAYYSQARTIDLLGLNDPWVARNGIPYLTMAAHEKIATFDYVLSQNVNLLIDQPKMIPNTQDNIYTVDTLNLFHIKIDPEDLPDEAAFLIIPINETHSLLTLYLNPHPSIEAAIDQYEWGRYPVNPS